MQTIAFKALWITLILVASNFNNPLYAQSDSFIQGPEFSHGSAFYPEAFNLTLQHSNINTKIYYTLDGSIPDPENLKGSTYQYKNEYAQPPSKPKGELLEKSYQTYLYNKPIFIEDRSTQADRLATVSTTLDQYPDYFPGKPTDTWFNKIGFQANRVINKVNRFIIKENKRLVSFDRRIRIYLNGPDYIYTLKEYIPLLPLVKLKIEPIRLYKGTPVRAIAVDVNNNKSEVITHTLFIGERSKFKLPVVNITVSEKNLFDYNQGVFVGGKDYDDWLNNKDDKTKHKGWDAPDWHLWWPANWHRKIKVQDVNIDFIDEQNQPSVNALIKIRPHGNHSLAHRNKSIDIYPVKSSLQQGVPYDVFADGTELGLSRIVLRNSGNDFYKSYIHDATIQRIMTGLNYGTQRYRPMVVFINGEYYGILNARDKLDKRYLAKRFNLPAKKVDLLKRNKLIQHGDAENWEGFYDFVQQEPKDSAEFYPQLESKIDVASFIDYFSSEIFIANTDWPDNNIRYWRYRGSKKHPLTAEGYTDGRWRWLMYDTDLSLDSPFRNKDGVKHNTIASSAAQLEDDDKYAWSTVVLRNLFKNPEFTQRFIIRFADLLNSSFQPERMVAIVRDTQAGIKSEMPRHIERWSLPYSLQFWEKSVNNIVSFLEQRPTHQWQHLQDYFELDERYTVSVELAQQGSGTIQLNSLNLGEAVTTPAVTDIPLSLPWSGQYFSNLPLTLIARPASGYSFSHWESENLTDEQTSNPILELKPNDNIQIRAVMRLESAEG